MARLMTVTAILALGLTACGRDDETASLKSGFGEMHMRLVDQAEREASTQIKSMGVLMIALEDPTQPDLVDGIPYCTAFRISADHIVTPAHCVKKEKIFFFEGHLASGKDAELGVLNLGGTVRLEFLGETAASVTKGDLAKALAAPLYVDKIKDIAIFRSPSSSQDYIDPSSYLSESSDLALLSFPHGTPLTLSDRCTSMGRYGSAINHDCDAFSGSSGGLLYDLASGKPVGMHNRGVFLNSYDHYRESAAFESAQTMAENFCLKKYQSKEDPNFEKCFKHFEYNKAVSFEDILKALESVLSTGKELAATTESKYQPGSSQQY